MEEELSENELEEQMYAMIHYVDDTQANVNTKPKDNNIVENVPQSTVRRYWRTNIDQNTPYQKTNTARESTINKETVENTNSKARDDKSKPLEQNSADLSIFQQPVSVNIKKTVEILENEDDKYIVELESSDEDEVIEVALPPKPTITIESSDEDDVCHIAPLPDLKKEPTKPAQETKNTGDREVTASPVPSVVSSISDDFIRGDCIALNISSKHPNNQSFDFSLHGSDLLDQTPSKKKKKKKNKDKDTATPISNPISVSTPVSSAEIAVSVEECFATPKSKAKNKRQRTKSYRVSEKSIPNPDVYDSDSNQSINESNKNQTTYSVTDKSLPNTDVYESDSNPSENARDATAKEVTNDVDNSDSSTTESPIVDIVKTPKSTNVENRSVVDLTTQDVNTTIDENIVMANVTGFTDMDEYSDHDITTQDISKCGSTKIPAILNEDLDFDNLKGSSKMCKRRRYSLTTLRAEMEKFYNESWGGEEFNHREIQKNMSRDKSLWVIDAKDRMPSMTRRKITCSFCNRPGHREDACRFKPPVCFMCGAAGHYEPRCPRKICVNCGSPNYVYSTMCRNCFTWKGTKCAECGQSGHPASHCPDVWRRYHHTLSLDTTLEEERQSKKNHQMFCSGCTRRGHLVHTCRLSLPFSGLPINSPYVSVYRPVYQMLDNANQTDYGNKKCKNRSNSEDSSTIRQDRMKRQSKSPTAHDTHVNKKRNVGTTIEVEITQGTKSPNSNNQQRKVTISKDQSNNNGKNVSDANKKSCGIQSSDKALDFIPVPSDNHDKRGQIIQDNEVSDTSEVITSARVYITKEISDLLMTDDGNLWLNTTIKNNNLFLENETITFYLSINGTVGNQEAFQAELRDWIKSKQPEKERERFVSESEADHTLEGASDQHSLSSNIPKNRNNALRKLNKAFDSLKKDLGDPKALYKELTYLQNKHQQLVNQKAISPKQLTNNRDNINVMLRKLNMVLLGQAGLADGSTHLKELHTLQEKLTNFRQKNIPISLREEIGEHFHSIFTALPRDDYTDLLSKFYGDRHAVTFKKKKNDKSFKVGQKPNMKSLNPIQNVQRNVIKDDSKENNIIHNDTKQLTAATKNKLVFYHRRLLHSRPIDAVLKKTRSELVRKLHFNIALLGGKTHMSSKALKKMRKIQEQAQLFLTNF